MSSEPKQIVGLACALACKSTTIVVDERAPIAPAARVLDAHFGRGFKQGHVSENSVVTSAPADGRWWLTWGTVIFPKPTRQHRSLAGAGVRLGDVGLEAPLGKRGDGLPAGARLARDSGVVVARRDYSCIVMPIDGRNSWPTMRSAAHRSPLGKAIHRRRQRAVWLTWGNRKLPQASSGSIVHSPAPVFVSAM